MPNLNSFRYRSLGDSGIAAQLWAINPYYSDYSEPEDCSHHCTITAKQLLVAMQQYVVLTGTRAGELAADPHQISYALCGYDLLTDERRGGSTNPDDILGFAYDGTGGYWRVFWQPPEQQNRRALVICCWHP
jgi:hypothetical protein